MPYDWVVKQYQPNSTRVFVERFETKEDAVARVQESEHPGDTMDATIENKETDEFGYYDSGHGTLTW